MNIYFCDARVGIKRYIIHLWKTITRYSFFSWGSDVFPNNFSLIFLNFGVWLVAPSRKCKTQNMNILDPLLSLCLCTQLSYFNVFYINNYRIVIKFYIGWSAGFYAFWKSMTKIAACVSWLNDALLIFSGNRGFQSMEKCYDFRIVSSN